MISVAYTINFVTTAVITLFGGNLKAKLGLKRCLLLGGVFLGGGLILCGFMHGDIWELYLGFGLLHGVGVGFVYPVLIAYSVQILPERSGFAGGASTGAFALGALIWAPATTAIYQWKGDISYSFLYLGVIMMVVIAGLSLILQEAPKDFYKEFNLTGGKMTISNSLYHLTKKQMLKNGLFYAIFITLIMGLTCGSMIVSYSSPIVQTTFGMPTQTAAILVGVLSIASAVGRITWGSISDKVGKCQTLFCINVVMGVAMIMLLMLKHQTPYIAMLVLATLCYGGVACIVGPITTAVFGAEHFVENYSVMYMAYAVSSIIGPPVISMVKDMTGSFSGAYTTGLVVSTVGAFLSILAVVADVKARRAMRNPEATTLL